MKLIVGLGNPEARYEKTRHNLGFMAVDALAKRLGLSAGDFKPHHKAKALVAEAMIDNSGAGEKIFLVKPQTYMNASGEAVLALVSFYKLSAADVVIAHDELDLPFGSMRISAASAAGGHNGVISVFEKLGTKNITRLRLGIKNNQRAKIPGDKFVLLPFSLFERLQLKSFAAQAGEALECLASNDPQACMNRFN